MRRRLGGHIRSNFVGYVAIFLALALSGTLASASAPPKLRSSGLVRLNPPATAGDLNLANLLTDSSGEFTLVGACRQDGNGKTDAFFGITTTQSKAYEHSDNGPNSVGPFTKGDTVVNPFKTSFLTASAGGGFPPTNGQRTDFTALGGDGIVLEGSAFAGVDELASNQCEFNVTASS